MDWINHQTSWQRVSYSQWRTGQHGRACTLRPCLEPGLSSVASAPVMSCSVMTRLTLIGQRTAIGALSLVKPTGLSCWYYHQWFARQHGNEEKNILPLIFISIFNIRCSAYRRDTFNLVHSDTDYSVWSLWEILIVKLKVIDNSYQ